MPLWLAHGIDRQAGGFHEHLTGGDYRCTADFRRLRVAARQVFVFARAQAQGVAGADAAVALGVDFLARHAALPGGGYASRFTLANQPIAAPLDLYDHAFVLLALASAASVLPAAPLRARALALLDFIDTEFAHPLGGYQESLPPSLPRRQNPHMHLLEALLAAHEAFSDGPFLARARTLLDLFQSRFLDPATGALVEFLGDDLRPARSEAGFLVEPGHHYEWVWLLHRARVLGLSAADDPSAAALMGFAEQHGAHPTSQDAIDGLRSTGTQHVLTSRLWPQTERLKALRLWPGASPAARAQAASGLARWLLPDGLWHERRDADGAPIPGSAPASSLASETL